MYGIRGEHLTVVQLRAIIKEKRQELGVIHQSAPLVKGLSKMNKA